MIQAIYKRSSFNIKSFPLVIFLIVSVISNGQDMNYRIIDNLEIFNDSLNEKEKVNYLKDNFKECYYEEDINEYFEIYMAWLQDSIEVVVNDITIFNERTSKFSESQFFVISDSITHLSNNVLKVVFHDEQLMFNYTFKDDFKSMLIIPFFIGQSVETELIKDDTSEFPKVITLYEEIRPIKITIAHKSYSFKNYTKMINCLKQ